MVVENVGGSPEVHEWLVLCVTRIGESAPDSALRLTFRFEKVFPRSVNSALWAGTLELSRSPHPFGRNQNL